LTDSIDIMSKNNKSVLVIFIEDLPNKSTEWWHRFDTVVAPQELKRLIPKDLAFANIDDFVKAGSIYKGSAFAEELSHLKLPDGSRIAKSFTYKDYELWWIYYSVFFLHFGLPYTQYRKLLEYLGGFQSVHLYQPPYKSLFSYFLEAYGSKCNIIQKKGLKSPSFLPFGVFLQILITLISVPILMVRKRQTLVFTGDKFEKSHDYDFRMKFIYEDLRQKNLLFVEFIRSLESWKTVIKHAIKRRRPVIYSEAVTFVGRFLSFIMGGHYRAKRQFGAHKFAAETNPEKRFKLLIANHYLLHAYDDIWAIRIMKLILRLIGVRVSLAIAASDRNFHTVLGCKLNAIPTIGILHGVASRYYNVHEFTPGFDGEKMLSVDKYGLWSEWWKKYYLENSRAYRKDQLFVSGPMRPLDKNNKNIVSNSMREPGPIRVLFISEQLAIPHEVMPYLEVLLQEPNIEVTFSFRPYRDGFRDWLIKHKPDFLKQDNIRISKEGLQDSIKGSDVVVGTMSTAVLEALLQLKVPLYFKTQKWGDYYSLKEYNEEHSFFADNPEELVEKIKKVLPIKINTLKDLQERYFGDPYKNGSKWVVEQAEKILKQTS